MKRFLLFASILLNFLNLNAQQFSISDSAVISLITCSPGEEIYSKFGHSAIRINDPKNNLDVVFNYGIFSFETNNFYYKFIKGETDYQLGVYDTRYFLPEYAARNSMVVEQILNLTPPEKKTLFALLSQNYQPENRTYRYNFVFDNCATRPRDKILASLHGYVKFQNFTDSKTFRQLIGNYIGNDTWLKFGIDVVFGIEADRIATESESMFLPEILMSEFQTAEIITQDGKSRKLVSDRSNLVQKTNLNENQTSWLFKPLTFSIFLLIVGSIITFWDTKRRHYYKPFDAVLFGITGLGGIIVFYLMFFSLHPLVKNNLNILWLNPLNLLIVALLWIRKLRVAQFFYQILNVLILLGALLAFALSAQSINIAAFPIIVLLLMRNVSFIALTRKKIYRRRR
ncbi:MAG: DUF4105 domain-containing protein [Paludibacter sp.]|nr:DUF4105 domain-containing protein [Paludibacter sp.]